MASEHQIFVNAFAMRDILQTLLDAETARIGEPPGGEIVMVFP